MLFDSHTHLNLSGFDKDREEVLERSLKEGVFMINVGTLYENSKKAVEMSHQYKEGVWAAVGIHPSHTFPSLKDPQEINQTRAEVPEQVFDDRFYKLAQDGKVVAIGECGLDYSYLKDLDSEKQKEYIQKEKQVFRQHISLAKELKKGLIVHTRDVYEEAMSEIKNIYPDASGVFHFFTGTAEQAKAILEAGFYIGLSGVITYGTNYDEMILSLPLDRILIETDAPYAAPNPYRGQRNEPAYVKYVAEKISRLKGVMPNDVYDITTQNACNLFKIKIS